LISTRVALKGLKGVIF